MEEPVIARCSRMLQEIIEKGVGSAEALTRAQLFSNGFTEAPNGDCNHLHLHANWKSEKVKSIICD